LRGGVMATYDHWISRPGHRGLDMDIVSIYRHVG
jgi:hypothetical protein